MARIVGRNTSLYIKNSASSFVQLTSYSNVITLTVTAKSPDVTAYGEAIRSHLPDGCRDWKLTVDGLFATEVDSILSDLLGQETTFWFGQSGSSKNSNVRYCGNCILDEYSNDAAVGNTILINAKFLASGPIERDSWTFFGDMYFGEFIFGG